MIEMFDDNERIFINSVGSEMSTENFTKSWFLDTVRFQKNIGNEEIQAFLEELEDKVEALSEDEWTYMTLLLPLPTSVEVDGVDMSSP